MQQKKVDVLIIGGGPAGMVAACLLSQAGLQTLVIERNDDFEREFRGEILQPRFHKLMKDVGLFDHVKAYPHEEIEQVHVYFGGRRIGGMRLGELDPQSGPTWWMTQPTLLGALHDRCRSSSNFEMWFGASVKELKDGTARVTWEGEFHEIEAKVIVGADGRFSAVRKLGRFELEYDHNDLDVVWFNMPRPEDYQHIFSFLLTARRNYLLLPKYPNLLQCGLVLRPGEFNAVIRRQPVFVMQKELAGAHPAFAEFAQGLQDFSPFFPLKGSTACVARWANDGIVLVGDAAHTCSPVGGIGVAVAVETAAVAASVIIEAFDRYDFSRGQLDKVQELRRKDVYKVHGIQQRIGWLFMRSPAFMRRLIPLIVPIASRTRMMPFFARQLVTQRRPLPLAIRLESQTAGQ
jgi:2-polyprenyl-6-methoxyphenol hydroxylase-like FAD-dependent oxidoreductase